MHFQMLQYNNKKLYFLVHMFVSYSWTMHWVMLYINLKTKYIPVTYSGCDYTYFTSKTKQVACYHIIPLKGASLLWKCQ